METEQNHRTLVADMQTKKGFIEKPRYVSETKNKACDVQFWKMVLVKEEQLHGVRALTFSVAHNYVQAIENDIPELITACESYFSRIAQNTELSSIFHTTKQLATERTRLRKAWLDASFDMTRSPEEKEAAGSTFDAHLRLVDDYAKKLDNLQDTQPFSEAPTHRLCKDALQDWVQSGILPQKHMKECSVCS